MSWWGEALRQGDPAAGAGGVKSAGGRRNSPPGVRQFVTSDQGLAKPPEPKIWPSTLVTWVGQAQPPISTYFASQLSAVKERACRLAINRDTRASRSAKPSTSKKVTR